MKNITYFIVLFGLIQAEGYGQETLLTRARETINNAKGISYFQQSIYPNPMGSNDTISSKNEFDLVSNDFKFTSSNYQEIYIHKNLSVIDDKEKKVKIFRTEKEVENFKSNNRNLIFSPVNLLELDWTKKEDLTEKSTKYSTYLNVEMDCLV